MYRIVVHGYGIASMIGICCDQWSLFLKIKWQVDRAGEVVEATSRGWRDQMGRLVWRKMPSQVAIILKRRIGFQGAADQK